MRTRSQAFHSVAPIAFASLLALGACGGRPDDHLVAETTHLVQYDSCGDLENDLEDALIREVEANIDRDQPRYELPPASPGAEDTAGGKDGRREGVDYSGTNNQEKGVDEADFVKTDGYHIYTLNGNRLHIFGVPRFGALVPESTTTIEGYPTQLLVHGDANRLAVFSTIDTYALPEGHPLRALAGRNSGGGWYWRTGNLTKITVLDISNRAAPALVREVFFEGWYQTARRIGGSVRLATYSMMNVPPLWRWWQYWEDSGHDKAAAKAAAAADIRALTLDDFIPQMYVRAPDGSIEVTRTRGETCRSFYRPSDSIAHGVSSILSFDLFRDHLAFDADQIVSNWATFYASTDTLVLAEMAHDAWWFWEWQDDPEHLNVHAFDIATPGRTRYLGSGRIEGALFDPFSIDEEDGYLRLATTTNRFRWWRENPPPMENHIWVLARRGDTLATVGHLGGIAPGEAITTARMLGDKGFLVTFERIDPLWTLDLSRPDDPRLVGELEVPGFSTYLHPLADGRLLSIGIGGNENGADWRTTISLFDVRNFARPKLTASLPLELDSSWGWSEALWEHKAFQYWAPKKLLAVPQSTYEITGAGPDGWSRYRYLSRLELVNVDPAGALTRRGAIDHSAYYNSADDQRWPYVDIRRSIFMGDFIYAISDRAISVHRVSDLGEVAVQPLPGYEPGRYWWWW